MANLTAGSFTSNTATKTFDKPALGFLNVMYQGAKIGKLVIESPVVHSYLMENPQHAKFLLEDATGVYNANVAKKEEFTFRRA